MNKSLKNIILSAMVFLGLSACEKADQLPFYNSGEAATLTANPTAVVLGSTNLDADALSFSWTDPKFAQDSSLYKFVVEMAPAGTNFAQSVKYSVNGARSLAVKGSELQALMLKWNIPFGTAANFDTRLISSYNNNNDQKVGPILNVSITPYSMPIALSSSENAAFEPVITKKDDVLTTLTWNKPDYGTANASYVLQYDTAGANLANAKEMVIGSEIFTEDLTGLELNSMAQAAGIAYGSTGKIDVRVKATKDGADQYFYSNVETYSVKPSEMTLYLHMAGDYQGWNPGEAPRIASTDGIHYDGYVWVPAGGSGEFKFTSSPDWDHTNYGGTGNTIDANGGNLKWPATGKFYRVQVDMAAKIWSATETNWGVIGSGTPGGWDNSTNLTYDPATKKWKGTVNFTDGEFKFRANNAWDISLGGSATQLTYGGQNIAVTAGSKVVELDLSNPTAFTFKLQ